MNSFDRKVFSRQTSLEISFVLKGSYEVVTEHVSHVLREQELVVIVPNEIHILKKRDPDSVILILHIDFDRIPETLLGSCDHIFFTTICNSETNAQLFVLLNEDIHLSDIAKTLSFSNSYTSRLFNRFTGLPFVKYLSYVRVRESLEDLLECKISIEEISGKCGMPNSKAYTQIFKELYGITPSTYRKRFLKNLQPLPENDVRPMEFTKEQKELMEHAFQLEERGECIYRSKDVTIEKQEDTLLLTLANQEEREVRYTQKGDRLFIQIHPIQYKS